MGIKAIIMIDDDGKQKKFVQTVETPDEVSGITEEEQEAVETEEAEEDQSAIENDENEAEADENENEDCGGDDGDDADNDTADGDDDDNEDDDEDDEDDDDEEEDEEEEEDPTDPMDTLREKCSSYPKCKKFMEEFETCTERVGSKDRTRETCTQELLDFMHCRDECAAKSLFAHLK